MDSIEVGDGATNARAQLADALMEHVEADRRVHRCRRLDLTDDGGALVEVELLHDLVAIPGQVIARELEFTAVRALPKLAWVRVQVASAAVEGEPNR